MSIELVELVRHFWEVEVFDHERWHATQKCKSCQSVSEFQIYVDVMQNLQEKVKSFCKLHFLVFRV